MFVRLEDGQLFNLNQALRIKVMMPLGSDDWCLVLEYLIGEEHRQSIITRGTESQCNLALEQLEASLRNPQGLFVSHMLFPD